ncbi:hypothetical protein NL676_006706 [Syzygium grande]|nr:hypothetical protein NL676_006706 [Syzygium grande]
MLLKINSIYLHHNFRYRERTLSCSISRTELHYALTLHWTSHKRYRGQLIQRPDGNQVVALENGIRGVQDLSLGDGLGEDWQKAEARGRPRKPQCKEMDEESERSRGSDWT